MKASQLSQLLAIGDWSADQIACTWTPSTFVLPDNLMHMVETEWRTACAQPHVNLFDGPVCRLESFSLQNNNLTLRLSPNSYKNFIGTNACHPQWAEQYGQSVMANPVGTSVILCSADGHLIGGQRSQTVALYPNCAHPFGGMLEPGKDGTAPDVTSEIKRELQEEVALEESDINDLRAIGLFSDMQLRQPELAFVATTHCNYATIATRLDKEEHTALWSIADNKAAIEEVLATGTAITPILAATLIAYGTWRFGEAWLQTQLSELHGDQRAIN